MANAASWAVTVFVAGTATFLAGPQVDYQVGGARQRAGRVVGDSDGAGASGAGLVDHLHDLWRLPRLADGNEEVTGEVG